MVIQNIKDKIKYGKTRSKEWNNVRKKHLESNPTCAVCGSFKKVEVHHKKPFHSHPELELEPSNLITLCEGKEFSSVVCHLTFGHLGNYQDINPDVDLTSQVMKQVFDIKKIVKAEI